MGDPADSACRWRVAVFGRLPRHELDETRQDEITARDTYIKAMKEYNEALNEFKLRLNIPQSSDIKFNYSEFKALTVSNIPKIDIRLNDAIDIALSQRLDLANAYDETMDAARKAEVAANALKADLTLVGLIAPNTNTRRYFGADPGDLRRTSEQYELSLRLDLPLDRNAEKNNYRRMLLVLSERHRNHQRVNDLVELEVKNAYDDIVKSYERLVLQSEAKQLSQKRLDNTSLLLQYDRANSRDVLDAQKDHFDTHIKFTEALVNYQIARLEFLRDVGIISVNSMDTY